MYKTIRHGENSLQYTILPQHDDYSKGGSGGGGGGGLQSSAMAGSGSSSASLMPDALLGHGGPSIGGVKIVRNKRRSWMAYVGLFFVCSIITGAVLVPLLVSVEVLAGPKDWFYRHTGHGSGTVAGNRKATRVMATSAASSAPVSFRHEIWDRTNRTEATTKLIPVGDDALDKENAMEKSPPIVENQHQQQSRFLSILTSTAPPTDASLSAEVVEPSIYIEDPLQILPTDEYQPSKIVPAVTQTYLDYPSDTTIRTTSPKTKLPGSTIMNPGRMLRKPKVSSRPNNSNPAAITQASNVAVVTESSAVAGLVIAGGSVASSPTRNWIDSIVDSSTYIKWTVSQVFNYICLFF